MLAYVANTSRIRRMTTFSPEEVKARNPGGLNFADAWGLTCAQLGETVTKLLEVRPDVKFTRDDLVGYHFVQYGMDTDITKEVIEEIEEARWFDWEGAEALRNALPNVLGDSTTQALAFRIRLGAPRDVERLERGGAIDDYFETITEPDHHNADTVSLYPKAGVELTYRGRASLQIGSVIINNTILDLTTYSDVLDVMADGGSVDRTLVASSSTRSSIQAIRSLRLM